MVTLSKTNGSEIPVGNRSESLYNNLRTYGYIDSINTIYEDYHTFKSMILF